MSKKFRIDDIMKVLLMSLVLGAIVTLLSLVHSYATTGQYCSPDPGLNSRIDCSLQVGNRGWPLVYVIYPDFQPRHGIQALELIGDIAVWSALSWGIISFAKKRKHHA